MRDEAFLERLAKRPERPGEGNSAKSEHTLVPVRFLTLLLGSAQWLSLSSGAAHGIELPRGMGSQSHDQTRVYPGLGSRAFWPKWPKLGGSFDRERL
jgi:hypothetical protein